MPRKRKRTPTSDDHEGADYDPGEGSSGAGPAKRRRSAIEVQRWILDHQKTVDSEDSDVDGSDAAGRHPTHMDSFMTAAEDLEQTFHTAPGDLTGEPMEVEDGGGSGGEGGAGGGGGGEDGGGSGGEGGAGGGGGGEDGGGSGGEGGAGGGGGGEDGGGSGGEGGAGGGGGGEDGGGSGGEGGAGGGGGGEDGGGGGGEGGAGGGGGGGDGGGGGGGDGGGDGGGADDHLPEYGPIQAYGPMTYNVHRRLQRLTSGLREIPDNQYSPPPKPRRVLKPRVYLILFGVFYADTPFNRLHERVGLPKYSKIVHRN